MKRKGHVEESARDRGSVPGWRRSPGGGNSIAWRIPWIEEPGGLQSMGSQNIPRGGEAQKG